MITLYDDGLKGGTYLVRNRVYRIRQNPNCAEFTITDCDSNCVIWAHDYSRELYDVKMTEYDIVKTFWLNEAVAILEKMEAQE